MPPLQYTLLSTIMSSFTIAESMLYREYSDTESKAIHCVSILYNHVTIAWKTNPEKQYIFKGSIRFIAHLRAILTNFIPDEMSIGSIISKARKVGDLEIIKDF